VAQSFDIRFARSSGLAAYFQAPTNTFRWKGAGRLSIDAEGIIIAVSRGVNSLFAQTRRVSATDLKGVLREGEALRLEFAMANNPRAAVPFWVHDQETAETIVRLLPTTHTVELNHDAAGVAHAQGRIDWRALSLFVVALLAMAGSAWMLQRSGAPVPVVQRNPEPASTEPGVYPEPLVDAAANASAKPADPASRAPSAIPQPSASADLPVELAPPDPYAPDTTTDGDAQELVPDQPMPDTPPADAGAHARMVRRAQPREGVVAIGPDMPEYDAARRQLDLFMAETANILDCGAPSEWWEVSVRIYNDPDFNDPALWPLQQMEIAVSRAWRSCNSAGGFAKDFAWRLTNRLDLYVY